MLNIYIIKQNYISVRGTKTVYDGVRGTQK